MLVNKISNLIKKDIPKPLLFEPFSTPLPLPWHRRRSHIRVLTRRCGGGESGRGGLRRVVMVAAVLVIIGRVGGGWIRIY